MGVRKRLDEIGIGLMSTINEIFENIYLSDQWTHGSGPGSIKELNVPFLEFIGTFIRDNDVTNIVDVGCGDFQLFRQFEFEPAEYLGLDVVNSVVERNRREFGTPDVRFEDMPTDLASLPEADLYILKDILIHLDNVSSLELAASAVSKSKYTIFVNNFSHDVAEYNREICTGEFRAVDVTLAPFNFRAEEHFVFGKIWAYDPRLPKIFAMILQRRVWPGEKLVQLVRGKRPL